MIKTLSHWHIKLLTILGYTSLALLFLQAPALIVISTTQSMLYSQSTKVGAETSASILDTFSTIASGTTTTLPTRSTDSPNALLMVGVVIALVIALCALALYLTKIMAGITHALLRFLGRPTLNKLLTVKITLAGVSFIIITTCAVILPSVMPILPLDIGLVVLCFVASLLEHALATRAKLPVTKAL